MRAASLSTLDNCCATNRNSSCRRATSGVCGTWDKPGSSKVAVPVDVGLELCVILGMVLRPRCELLDAVSLEDSSVVVLPQRLLRLRGNASFDAAVGLLLSMMILLLVDSVAAVVAFKYDLRTGLQPGQLRTCFHKSG